MAKEKTIALLSDEKNGSENLETPPAYEEILHEIGEFGLNQILVSVTVGFAFGFGSFITMNFLFGADITEHRCWIPECEPINSAAFNTSWLERAVPYKDGRPDACSRYEYIRSTDGICSEQNFNRSRVVACDEYITKNNERRLLFHLNMVCTGQNKKLAMLGIAPTLGRTIAMPISGLISDKFGRLITITVCATLGAIFSTLQALPSHLMTFELYWTLEFLASLLSTGMMAAGFVYNMEWTTAKYRVRMINISTIIDTLIPYTVVSLVAWYFSHNFIAFRIVLAVPGFLVLIFYSILGESPQWLLAKNQYRRTIKSISTAARLNRRQLHAYTLQRIERLSELSSHGLGDDEQAINVTIGDLLRQKTLAFRLFITSVVWFFALFAYYGILFGSTKVHDNKYLSFALIGFADIPGTMINELLLNRIGRRWTIGLALPIFSMLLIMSTQLSAGYETLQLTLFVLGKIAICVACLGLYTFCTEFWPTSTRNTAASIGTTAARVGSILASVNLLLANYYVHLPVFLNAAAGIFAAVLIFAFLPETMHCEKLPDTIEEALSIGESKGNEASKFGRLN